MNYRRVANIFSYTVLIIACLNVFAFSVRHVVTGGGRFGIFTKAFEEFILFPKTVLKVGNQIYAPPLPPYHVKIDTSFAPINNLDYNVFALNARSFENEYVYRLVNLRTDSVLHKWSFKRKHFEGAPELFRGAHPLNPILLKNRSIVGVLYGRKNLFRLDKESNIVWHNTDKTFHHSLNLSHDGNIWACTHEEAYTINEHENLTIKFRDDYITKVDVKTGEILFDKSLSEILIDNGYINLVHGYGNEERSMGEDLLHLNDIEPVLFDGTFWNEGDLFLNLRHRAIILHYRPSSNKIIRIISGPFLSQHDVDIYSESQISIFNNNRTHSSLRADDPDNLDKSLIRANLKSSQIMVYDYADSTFTIPFKNLFLQEGIYTRRQGVHKFLSNGDVFVECTENGKVYIFRDDKILLKKYLNAPSNGIVEHPHWARIYEDISF